MTRKLMAVMAALALVLAACGDDDVAVEVGDLELVTAGTLTVCTDVPYPPMEFEDPDAPGGYTGFDIELVRAMSNELDLELVVATPGWESIESGIAMATGICDLAAASITILPERAENIAFSDAYFSGDQSLLVKRDSGITSLDDLVGHGLAVQSATTGAHWAEENAPEGVEIVAFEDAAAPYLALEAGQVGGVLTDIVGNQGVADEDPTVVVAEVYPTDEEYGLGLPVEGAEALLDAINSLLAQFRADGTYDQIYEDWFPSA